MHNTDPWKLQLMHKSMVMLDVLAAAPIAQTLGRHGKSIGENKSEIQQKWGVDQGEWERDIGGGADLG